MRSIFLVFVSGCCLGCGNSQELASLKSSLRITGEKVVAKQDKALTILRDNTTALAAIKSQIETIKIQSETLNSQEVIESNPEPQEAAKANPSQPLKPVASPPAVRLFVTHAPFYCPPCERLKAAVANGEFDGFIVEDSGDFPGLRSYPAIRFETPTTQTGWGVVYGYDQNTIPTLRALTQGTGAPATGAIFPIQAAAEIVSPRFTFRPVSRWFGYNRGQRVKTRKSCPASGCPRG